MYAFLTPTWNTPSTATRWPPDATSPPAFDRYACSRYRQRVQHPRVCQARAYSTARECMRPQQVSKKRGVGSMHALRLPVGCWQRPLSTVSWRSIRLLGAPLAAVHEGACNQQAYINHHTCRRCNGKRTCSRRTSAGTLPDLSQKRGASRGGKICSAEGGETGSVAPLTAAHDFRIPCRCNAMGNMHL